MKYFSAQTQAFKTHNLSVKVIAIKISRNETFTLVTSPMLLKLEFFMGYAVKFHYVSFSASKMTRG